MGHEPFRVRLFFRESEGLYVSEITPKELSELALFMKACEHTGTIPDDLIETMQSECDRQNR